MENENLENKSNVKKSNLRNYDENPIVIKDYKPQVHLVGIFLMFIAFVILSRKSQWFYDFISYGGNSLYYEIFR